MKGHAPAQQPAACSELAVTLAAQGLSRVPRCIAVLKAWNPQTPDAAHCCTRGTVHMPGSKPESVPQHAVDFGPRRHNAAPGSNLRGRAPQR